MDIEIFYRDRKQRVSELKRSIIHKTSKKCMFRGIDMENDNNRVDVPGSMDIIMVAAPLGVDRTGFISYLIENLMVDGPRNVVVLRNDMTGKEFDLVTDCDVSVENLRGGCVSCSLKSDLIPAIREISSRSGPEIIIFETNHNAQPAVVIDAMMGCTGFDIGEICTIVILDARLFNNHHRVWEKPLSHQLKEAQLVVIDGVNDVEDLVTERVMEMVRNMGYEGSISYFPAN